MLVRIFSVGGFYVELALWTRGFLGVPFQTTWKILEETSLAYVIAPLAEESQSSPRGSQDMSSQLHSNH